MTGAQPPSLPLVLYARSTLMTPPDPATFTGRDVEVLAAMAQGRAMAAVGREWRASETVMRRTTRGLFVRLGVGDAAHAVGVAYTLGVLTPEAPSAGVRAHVLACCAPAELAAEIERRAAARRVAG